MTKSSGSSVTYPFAYATPLHRLGGRSLGILITCVLSPLISIPWNLFAWGRSQTAGMNSLKLRIYSTDTGMPVLRRTIFLRNCCIPLLYSVVPAIYLALGLGIQGNISHDGWGQVFVALGYFFFLVTYMTDILWIFRGDKRQRLRDVLVHTVVLNECLPTESALDSN